MTSTLFKGFYPGNADAFEKAMTLKVNLPEWWWFLADASPCGHGEGPARLRRAERQYHSAMARLTLKLYSIELQRPTHRNVTIAIGPCEIMSGPQAEIGLLLIA